MYTNLIQKIDREIAAQLKILGIGEKKRPKIRFPAITISREFGCEGILVARALSRRLSTDHFQWAIFHRELFTELSGMDDIQKDLLESVSTKSRGALHQYIEHLLAHKPTDVELYKKMAEAMRILAMNGRSIILGSGGAILTSGIKNVFNVRLQADIGYRTERVSQLMKISKSEAKNKIQENDTIRQEFIYEFTRKDIREPHLYNLIFDNQYFNAEQIAEIIHLSLDMRNLLPKV